MTPKPNISPQTEETTQSASEVEPIVSDVQTATSKPSSKFEFLPKYDLTGEGEYSGLGIILVNHSCGRLDRPGARKDLENFKHIFQNMKLKIVIKENFNYKIVVNFIKEEIKTHEKLKSYFLAISTHGTEDGIYCHNGTLFEISVLVNELQKPIHAGKPKVLFIQACRGDSESADMSIVTDDIPTVATLESDMLKAYSCVKGYTSFREADEGSWFVASLRACFDGMKRPCNILQLLTATNNYMLTHFEVKNELGVKIRQSCEVSHTLCAELIV